MNSQPKIILASQSPRRKELLNNAGIDCCVEPSPYIEEFDSTLSAHKLAAKHAYGKAKEVAKQHTEGIIIGVDTLVLAHEKVLEKPRDEKEAFETIKLQQNSEVEVISALTMIDAYKDIQVSEIETTKVHFHPMTDEEIHWYISTGEWKDKSGGFAIQGIGSRYIKGAEGDFLSVVGLPMQMIYQILKKWGYQL
jgi:septum formation protein